MVRLSLDTTVDRTAARPVVITYVGADNRTLLFTATEDGSAMDLSSYTVTISAQYETAEKIVSGSVTLDTAADGEISFTPTAAQLDVAGDYHAQIRLDDGSANIDYLEPFTLRVEPVVYLTP